MIHAQTKGNGVHKPRTNGEDTAAISVLTQPEFTAEIRRVMTAVQRGQVHERARLDGATAEEQRVLEEFNDGLDSLTTPLAYVLEFLGSLSKGEPPQKITAEFPGELDTLKQQLNQCSGVLSGLQETSEVLKRLAVNDCTMQVVGSYPGIVGQLAQSTNTTHDRMLQHIAARDDLERVFDLIPGPIIIMDREHTILQLNQTAARTAGRTKQSCVGAKFWELFDNPDCHAGTCAAARALKTGVVCEGLARPLIQGKEVPVLVTAAPRFGQDGQAIGVIELVFPVAAEISLADEIDRVVKAAQAGQLNERVPQDRFEGRHRERARAINDMLDAIAVPLLDANQVLKRMAVNDHTVQMEGTYSGVFAELCSSMNLVQTRVRHVVEICQLISAGEYAKKLDELRKIGRRSEHDQLVPSLVDMMEAIDALVTDTQLLADAAVAGKLGTRVEASRHRGDYRKVVEGINATLDAVVGPLNVAADYVDQISQGRIPPCITSDYNGEFSAIRNNLNRCIDALGGLAEANDALGKMAVNDYTVSVAGSYPGIFGQLAQSSNTAQERMKHTVRILQNIAAGAFKQDLADLSAVHKRSENDTLVPAFIQTMQAISALVDDMQTLSTGAVKGQLAARADASHHQGEYRKVIEGVNATLDAVIGPLEDVGQVLDKLAGGDLTAQITNQYAGDFDKLRASVNTLATQVRSAIQQIGVNATALVSAAAELNRVSQQMSASAEETATQANLVSAASEQVAGNVQTVATGADEMGASIKEIAKNTSDATRVATTAVKSAEATNETISKLGQSSAEIGQVIKVITSIAQQTNLLALNATIEAARAGEAGKGFAVVANEVKELAKETAKATEDISRKIEAIQSDTKGAVAAIGQIGNVIVQINDIQNTIASAVEEQSATTNEISRNLSEAAHGSSEITKNISGVAEAARSTTTGANDAQKSAQALERMAADLQGLIAQFKY